MNSTNNEQKLLDEFFKTRNELIDDYTGGKLSKTELIDANYKYITELDLKPFENRINCFKMGIYNYQYFNMLAKYCNMKAEELKFWNYEESKEYKTKEDQYYDLKDQSTMQCLEFVGYENVDAYFLELNSVRLTRSQLFEVVFRDYDKAIFHSCNERVLRQLRINGVFSSTRRKSIIDGYVNSKY